MGFPCSGRFPCHACHRHYPGGTDRAHSLYVPGRLRPSPSVGRVGSHIRLFEACSTFTHVTACMRAESPYATLLHRSVFSESRYLLSPLRLLPTAATLCRVGFTPTGNRRLCTAHQRLRRNNHNEHCGTELLRAIAKRVLRTHRFDAHPLEWV